MGGGWCVVVALVSLGLMDEREVLGLGGLDFSGLFWDAVVDDWDVDGSMPGAVFGLWSVVSWSVVVVSWGVVVVSVIVV